jgi:hypothetical protein
MRSGTITEIGVQSVIQSRAKQRAAELEQQRHECGKYDLLKKYYDADTINEWIHGVKKTFVDTLMGSGERTECIFNVAYPQTTLCDLFVDDDVAQGHGEAIEVFKLLDDIALGAIKEVSDEALTELGSEPAEDGATELVHAALIDERSFIEQRKAGSDDSFCSDYIHLSRYRKFAERRRAEWSNKYVEKHIGVWTWVNRVFSAVVCLFTWLHIGMLSAPDITVGGYILVSIISFFLLFAGQMCMSHALNLLTKTALEARAATLVKRKFANGELSAKPGDVRVDFWCGINVSAVKSFRAAVNEAADRCLQDPEFALLYEPSELDEVESKWRELVSAVPWQEIEEVQAAVRR